jgi:hypothetical protein
MRRGGAFRTGCIGSELLKKFADAMLMNGCGRRLMNPLSDGLKSPFQQMGHQDQSRISNKSADEAKNVHNIEHESPMLPVTTAVISIDEVLIRGGSLLDHQAAPL